MATTIILPCGTTAEVEQFNGRVEKMLTDEELQRKADFTDKILIECTRSIDGERADLAKRLLRLLTGSRKRILLEARRLAYGDEVKLEWKCVHCEADNAELEPAHISKLEEVSYPDERELSIEVEGKHIVLQLPRGLEEVAFENGLQKKLYGLADMAFACVKTVDGQPVGPLWFGSSGGSLNKQVRSQFNAWARRFGPQTGQKCVCASCKRTNVVHITSVPDFFHRGLIEEDES